MAFRDRRIDKYWTVREIISPDGEVLPRKYLYKGKEVPHIHLTGRLSRMLGAYTLIEKDLRSVITWLKIIETHCHKDDSKNGKVSIATNREVFDVVKGLWVASLTFYGKCFTSADERKVFLNRDFIDKEFRDTHDKLIHIRDNYAAHSGSDAYELAKVALVNYSRKKSEFKIFTELAQQDFWSGSNENDLLVLSNHVRDKILQKIEIINKKIFKNEILPNIELYKSKFRKR